MQFIPYLTNFNGKCREAFDFYSEVLGGKIIGHMTYGESPMCDQMPPGTKDLIMHSCLQVGKAFLMGADSPPPEVAQVRPATSPDTVVNIEVDTVEDAERIWAAFTQDGDVKMPLQETFWAQRWGMFVDRYGKSWMINCVRPDCVPAE